jgi:hypothetical protein
LSPFSFSDIHRAREGSVHTGGTLDRLAVLVPVRRDPDEDRVNAHRPETHHLADHTAGYSGGIGLQDADRTSVMTTIARCVDRDFESSQWKSLMLIHPSFPDPAVKVYHHHQGIYPKVGLGYLPYCGTCLQAETRSCDAFLQGLLRSQARGSMR